MASVLKTLNTYHNAEVAQIGYKIMKGDWIVMELAEGGAKQHFTVTHVTNTRVTCKLKGRQAIKFKRYYSLPFLPIQKRRKQNYTSTNKWYVKMSKNISRLRLRHD